MGYNTHRRDSNHKSILKHAEKLGAWVIDLSQTKCGFDALIIYRGKTHIVEIKNPKTIAKTKPIIESLSENELDTMNQIKHRNVSYNIITTKKEIENLLLKIKIS